MKMCEFYNIFSIQSINFKAISRELYVDVIFPCPRIVVKGFKVDFILGRVLTVAFPDNVEGLYGFESEFAKKLLIKLEEFPEFRAFVKNSSNEFLNSVFNIYGKEKMLQMQTGKECSL